MKPSLLYVEDEWISEISRGSTEQSFWVSWLECKMYFLIESSNKVQLGFQIKPIESYLMYNTNKLLYY